MIIRQRRGKQISALLLMTVILCCGCSNHSSWQKAKDRYVVGVVTKSNTSEYWMSVNSGMEAAAAKYDMDVITLAPDSELDREVQEKQVEKLIDQNVDALAVAPIDSYHVPDYLDEIEKRGDEMCKAERLYREGKLPKRVCHCDTKVNNMMFDEDGKVLCVIDLDTVMPSFIFSDYGDFLRTGANTGDEDDKDLDRVNFNMEIFKAFTKGYLEGAKSFLTPIEIENLPYAAALFPYMQCVRFLADYINGDTYYKIKYPEHNLVRTKAQFKLLQSVEEHTPEMVAFINECLANG